MTNYPGMPPQPYLEKWDAEIRRLQTEVERLETVMRGIGANRYWEGRWRDEHAENERLKFKLGLMTAERDVAIQLLAKVHAQVGESK